VLKALDLNVAFPTEYKFTSLSHLLRFHRTNIISFH